VQWCIDPPQAIAACSGEVNAGTVKPGLAMPSHIHDSGCNRTCLGSKVGMSNFVRRDIKVSLGNNGRSYMMARGYGDIGVIKGALFVPGLQRDLISTAELTLMGMEESTRGSVKEVWSGAIDQSEVVLRFRMDPIDRFYHWVDPYPELDRPRELGSSCMHTNVEEGTVSALKARGKDTSCTDVKLKLRQKIRQLTGDRAGGGPHSDDDVTKDPNLDRLVRSEVKRFLRGSKGTKHQPGTAGLNDLQRLHCRLAHASKTTILAVLSSGAAKGLGTTYDACKDLEIGICDACLRGKTDALNVPSSETTAETVVMPFERLHMDIKDMTVCSLQGNRYTTYIIDEGSDKHYVYHSKTKMDKEDVIKQFVKEEVLPSNHPMVKVLNADCDANFLDERFVEVCQLIGIRLKTSPPHVHQVNGRVERAIGADIKLMRSVMSRYNSPKDLWELALDYVVYTRNRLLSTVRKDRVCAEQRMSGEMPDLSIARPFDAPSWYFVYTEERTQAGAVFRPRVKYCRMMGYSKTAKGCYLVLDNNRRVQTRPQLYCKEYPGLLGLENLDPAAEPADRDSRLVGPPLQLSHQKHMGRDPEVMKRRVGEEKVSDEGVAGFDEDTWEPTYERPRTRAEVQREGEDEEGYWPRTANNAEVVQQAIASFLALDGFKLPDTPKTMEEALSGPDREYWAKARQKELDGIASRSTWVDSEVPKGKKVISSKWAFRVTWDADGSVKYRSRIVARGFSQIPDRDFDQTYAPTLQFKTLLVMLGMIATEDLEMEASDVGNAYLESVVDKDLYMLLPTDLWVDGVRQTVMLKKALYGLKQAGELWNKLFNKFLAGHGFTRCTADVCLYTKVLSDGEILYLLLYVDDLIIAAKAQSKIDEVKRLLECRFKMKHQQIVTQYLGMGIARDRERRLIYVSQSAYARAVVQQHLEESAEVSNIPGIPSTKLRMSEGGDEKPLYEIVGKLRFLADRTRPDLLSSVNALGSGAARPGKEHVRAARRILRYVKGTVESRLVLGGVSNFVPLGFCDASFTADGDSKSQYGYCVHMNVETGANIMKSKTSTVIPHSPCEAEVKAMDELAKEVLWLRVLLEEIGYPVMGPTVIYTDSTSGIDQLGAFKNSVKGRHYCRDLNFLRDLIERGVIRLVHVPGDQNHSDILTKDLGYDKFARFARMLMQGQE
jgi:hypothetical protein